MGHLADADIGPQAMVCDRFNVGELRDAVAGRWPIIERVVQWSGSTEDIAAFRRLVCDGPLSITPECRALATASIAQAVVKVSEGNVRLAKRHRARARDDVAVAGTLAAGELVRRMRRPPRRAPRMVLVG